MGAEGEGKLPVGVLFVGDGNGGCEDQRRTEKFNKLQVFITSFVASKLYHSKLDASSFFNH